MVYTTATRSRVAKKKKAALKKSYEHLVKMRDEVISMGVIPAVADWKTVNPTSKSKRARRTLRLTESKAQGDYYSFSHEACSSRLLFCPTMKHRYTALFSLAFLLLTLSISSPQLWAQRKVLRVMSYNVENFFDTEDDPTHDDDSFLPTGEHHWTHARYQTKIQHIAEVISAVGGEAFPRASSPSWR